MWANQSKMLLPAVSGFSRLIDTTKANRLSALATTKIQQSHKHPSLVTVIVDGYQGHHGAASQPTKYSEHHWRLPNTDPRNEGKFLFRLHTLDIYFWTREDADSFITMVERLLEPQQIEIFDVPPAPATHEQVMSPVVQQLESIAIQDTAYHNEHVRSSELATTSLPPPPAPRQPQVEAQKVPKTEETGAYQPLAYNPAAPPAPEPIKHREKTPPPPESEAGTGLAAAAYHDQTQAAMSLGHHHGSLSNSPYSYSLSSQGYASPPNQDPLRKTPSTLPLPPTGYASPPVPLQDHRSSSVSYFPPAPPQSVEKMPSSYSSLPPHSSPVQSSGSSPAAYSKLPSKSSSPPSQNPDIYPYGKELRRPDSPATEILGNSYVAGPPQPLQHLQPQYADYLETHHQSQKPEGGYSNYQYDQPKHHHKHHPHNDEYDVHSQVYRPTEEEAQKHKHRKHSENPLGQPSGKLEQKAEKVEKGVNRLFKKLEKRIG